MRSSSILVILTIILLSGCAVTGQRVASPEDPFAMPIEEFMHEHAVLRANLMAGEPRQLEEEEWEKFDDISTRLAALVGDATELEQIETRDRHQLYELRMQMVDLVVGDIEPTMVCFQQHTTGTRLRGTRRCYTLEELERNRFEAQTLMRYIQSQPQGAHPDS
jgi:hypothetical protein